MWNPKVGTFITSEFNKLNEYVFEKFEKIVFVVPESSKNNREYNDKCSDIVPIVRKYLPRDFFDRSGHNIKRLYDRLTINRPNPSDMSDKEYFTTKITPLLASIYGDSLHDGNETNRRCKMLLIDLMNAIEEDNIV